MSRGAALSDIAAVSDIKDMWAVEFAYFSDPDGNSWAPQEMAQTNPGERENGTFLKRLHSNGRARRPERGDGDRDRVGSKTHPS